MRTTFASFALAAMAAANPMPQAVTSAILPSASAPAGCQTSYSGTFEVEINNVTMSKRSLEEKRDGTALTLSLNNGVLKDAQGRTGYIASNRQFQFDGPPQAGAIYTAGWSLCSNGSLTIGANSIFYECLSGNFYNLYDVSQGKQCAPIYIVKLGNTAGAASQGSDGQITASPVPVTQLTDGQPQGTTAAPVTQLSDGQPQATTGAAVTQLSDGQPQATTGRPVTQISDGQIQATTGHPVTQISDGQIQATTGHPVTQISDGQIQATVTPARSTGSPVTQLSDGQPQAPSGKPIISTNTTMKATASLTPTQSAVAAYTGAAVANAVGSGFLGLAAAFAVALL